MPFPAQEPRLFTRAAIEHINPNQYGCYGLFRTGQWIYVGMGDIRARLIDHFNGGNPDILRERPTHYVTIVCNDYVECEKRLIRELNPCCNQKCG
jgi:hypothetical protein